LWRDGRSEVILKLIIYYYPKKIKLKIDRDQDVSESTMTKFLFENQVKAPVNDPPITILKSKLGLAEKMSRN